MTTSRAPRAGEDAGTREVLGAERVKRLSDETAREVRAKLTAAFEAVRPMLEREKWMDLSEVNDLILYATNARIGAAQASAASPRSERDSGGATPRERRLAMNPASEVAQCLRLALPWMKGQGTALFSEAAAANLADRSCDALDAYDKATLAEVDPLDQWLS